MVQQSHGSLYGEADWLQHVAQLIENGSDVKAVCSVHRIAA